MTDDGDSARIDYTIVVPSTPGGGERVPQKPADVLVGRYRVIRQIGKGGMGEVLVAIDEQVGREVAIKRMRAAAPSEKQIERFLREASVQGRLEHPAIVPVHEIGRDAEGLPFFAMKRLAGNSLAKIIGLTHGGGGEAGEASAFPLQRVLRAFAEVCLAVEFAHVRGIVHRDLKPDNIVLGDYGEVYVIDWGVAKVIGGADPDEFADVDSGSGEHATVAGTAIGTPGYMSPEQARGVVDVDGRADIYTLGCMLFEILAGAPLHPPGRPGLQSAVDGIDARPSRRAPDRGIAPELDAICVAATEVDRRERIQTARELGDRVLEYLDGDRDVAMRRALAEQHLARARAAFAAATAAARPPRAGSAAETVRAAFRRLGSRSDARRDDVVDRTDVRAGKAKRGRAANRGDGEGRAVERGGDRGDDERAPTNRALSRERGDDDAARADEARGDGDAARADAERDDDAALADDGGPGSRRRGGPIDPRIAIREAASALALDPTLDGAAELVGRLMLEPPRSLPLEVSAALAADDVRSAQETARAGIWAVVAALAFTPLLWWMAPAHSPWIAAFTGFLLVNGCVCFQVNRSRTPRPGLVVIANTVLVVFVSRMFSPLLIAPGIAAVLAMAMVLTPRFSLLGSAWTVATLLAGAILVPWILERAGVLHVTMTVDERGLLVAAPVVAGDQTRTMVVGALYAIGLIGGASLMANAMRARARAAARRLHLQAWQLRQLVP